MQQKSKAKNNPISTIWHEILFMRPFEFSLYEDPNVVLERLENLESIADPKRAHKYPYRVRVDGQDFHIKYKNHAIGMMTTRARGRVIVHGGTGETIVRGRVDMGITIPLFVLFIMVLMLFSFANFLPQLLIFLCCGFYAYRDRSVVVEQIGQVLDEGADEKGKRLSEDATDDAGTLETSLQEDHLTSRSLT